MTTIKQKIQALLSTALILFLGLGIAVSTVHSHHNLTLHNAPDFADTGQCLTVDVSKCPICGYILQTDIPSDSQVGTAFFTVEKIIPQPVYDTTEISFTGISSRAPPLSV